MNSPNQSVLITGANGFIGKYIRKEFSDSDITTLGLSSSNDIVCDLAKEVPNLNSVSFDLVIHCAGTSKEDLSIDTNYKGTKNLLQSFGENLPKALVYLSSVHVYGLTTGENIDEKTRLNPSTDYGRSKMLAEQELQRWCEEKGVVLTILRLAMTFGNGVHGKAKEMFDAICNGRYFHISGNEARRSVVMVNDVATAVRLTHNSGGIFNVADGYSPTVIALADSMAANTGSDKRIMHCPLKWLKLAAKIGDKISSLGRFANSEKLAILTSSLTFSNQSLVEATGMKFYNTIDVIARRSKNYPYEYVD